MPAVVAAVAGLAGGGGIIGSVLGFVIRAGLTIAVSYAASSLLSKKPKTDTASAQRDRTHMVRSTIAPRRVVFGRARVSGPMVFCEASGGSNKYLHIVVALAQGPCEAVRDLHVDDELVIYAEIDGWRVANSGRFAKSGAHSDTDPG